MTIFFKFWPKKIRKTVTTLQILRFKHNCITNLNIVEIDNAAY